MTVDINVLFYCLGMVCRGRTRSFGMNVSNGELLVKK